MSSFTKFQTIRNMNSTCLWLAYWSDGSFSWLSSIKNWASWNHSFQQMALFWTSAHHLKQKQEITSMKSVLDFIDFSLFSVFSVKVSLILELHLIVNNFSKFILFSLHKCTTHARLKTFHWDWNYYHLHLCHHVSNQDRYIEQINKS